MRKISIFILTMILAVLLCCCANKGNAISESQEKSDPEQSVSNEEPVAEIGLSKEDAALLGGYFIKDGEERFYQLSSGVNLFEENVYNNFFIQDANIASDIPVLHEGESLVLFSSDEIDVSQTRAIFDVVEQGYTIPLIWSNENNEFIMEEGYGYLGYDAKIDTIDGVSVDEFMGMNLLKNVDYCKSDGSGFMGVRGCKENENYTFDLLKFDESRQVTVGCYEGTNYSELHLRSAFKYYAFDACFYNNDGEYFRGNNASIALTKEGYAVIDTDSLEAGTYLIRERDDNYYIYDNISPGNEEMYIFIKE